MKNEVSDLISDIKEQVVYLRELGVESLSVNLPQRNTQLDATPVPVRHTAAIEIPDFPKPKPSAPGSRLASLPSLTKRESAMPKSNDIETVLKSASTAPAVDDSPLLGAIKGLPESSETMEQIWADLGNCTRCPLHEGRTQIVQTVGNYQSDLMFVGEAPGADEDAKGEPFVGRAGQLLNKIIEAIGLKREDVCIGNINRCRPPGNRQPTLPEANTCKPFLLREIAVIRPKVIVVMGNTALHNLLDTKVGISRMRGQFHEYYGVQVMPTFHPAYLLRDASKKREVWDDMKKVRDYLSSLEKVNT